jgi:alanine racemase
VSVTVGDLDHLDALIAAMTTALPRPRTALRTQLEVETGLGRGGLLPNDVSEAAERIAASPGVRLEGLWTHLQAAEDPARTAAQIRLFEEASGALGRAGIRLPARHVAASVALLGDDVAAYDGIRPGLSIYGLLPDELAGQFDAGKDPGFQPVMSLHARPVRVADLPAGWGISYGPTFQAARPSRIATLPLGYGDGWPRSLSNRAAALVRGTRVPLVGNVAMDAVMADVTDVPGRPVTTNDEFVLLGRQGAEAITAAELARLRTTNQWEIVTSMARRLPRVYHARSGPEGVRTLVSGGLG